MSKTRSIVCTTIYSEIIVVVEVHECKNCGREYAEVFDVCNDYKFCPYCGTEIGDDDAS